MPGATVASVTCVMLARPTKACMMPHTVPNRPTYGDTEPTVARNDRLASIASSSRWKLARIARRAPSSSAPGSSTRRSRSFMNSRMPEAKMRCIGEPSVRLTASVFDKRPSFRLI